MAEGLYRAGLSQPVSQPPRHDDDDSKSRTIKKQKILTTISARRLLLQGAASPRGCSSCQSCIARPLRDPYVNPHMLLYASTLSPIHITCGGLQAEQKRHKRCGGRLFEARERSHRHVVRWKPKMIKPTNPALTPSLASRCCLPERVAGFYKITY